MSIAVALASSSHCSSYSRSVVHGGAQPASWRPQSDWRERDPRS